MKKITAIICTIAMLAAFTGCDNGGGSESVPESGNSASAPESAPYSSGDPENEPQSGGSDSAPESSASGESAPEDEPTFLNCIDGTVVRTSDITKLEGTVYDVDGQLEQFSLGDLDKERFLNCDYDVTCEGFAYAFTSELAFNPVQNPDMFEAIEELENRNIWRYSGEEPAPSSEYYRVEPGDKFGALTVKSAKTVFYPNYSNYENMGIFGAYTWRGMLEFDGELELTGYVTVSRPNEGYDEGGEIRIVLDNECVGLIPVMKYYVDTDAGAVRHSPMDNWDSNGYGDLHRFSLGNLHDYDIDLDSLEEGDRSVHVRITVSDILSMGDAFNMSDVDARLLSLKKI